MKPADILQLDALDPLVVLGIMSGTSLDGLDLAAVQFTPQDDVLQFHILHAETRPYPPSLHQALDDIIHQSDEVIRQTERTWTDFAIDTVRDFIHTTGIHIHLIASHGHTVFHQPERALTLQIGDGAAMAIALRLPVVWDFRTQDVQLGGQGAPLVPIGDVLLFSQYQYCLNLGGIANVSFDDEHDQRIAFDICPCNLVLNYYSRRLHQPYDRGGSLAEKGQIVPELLNQWEQLEYYQLPPPKSLGREWVEKHFFLPDAEAIDPHDALRTATEHIARQIARACPHSGKMLITGGGAFNTFLIKRIRTLSSCTIDIPDDYLVEYKEALIFALMGYLRWYGQINVLYSATGARYNHSSGKIAAP